MSSTGSVFNRLHRTLRRVRWGLRPHRRRHGIGAASTSRGAASLVTVTARQVDSAAAAPFLPSLPLRAAGALRLLLTYGGQLHQRRIDFEARRLQHLSADSFNKHPPPRNSCMRVGEFSNAAQSTCFGGLWCTAIPLASWG